MARAAQTGESEMMKVHKFDKNTGIALCDYKKQWVVYTMPLITNTWGKVTCKKCLKLK